MHALCIRHLLPEDAGKCRHNGPIKPKRQKREKKKRETQRDNKQARRKAKASPKEWAW